MKHFYTHCFKAACILSLAFSGNQAFAQLPICQDKASNYNEGEFIDNAGKGMGFIPWQLSGGGTETSGHSLESSVASGMGDVNTDGQAFMLYGYDGQNAGVARYFRGTGSIADPGDARSYLLPGQIFSIDVAIGNRNGYKGVNITRDDGSAVLVTLAVDGNTYRFGHPSAGENNVNSYFPFDPQSVFTIEAYQLTDNTCEITLSRGNVTISTGEIAGQIGGFSIYESATTSSDPLNRLFFNNLLVERRCPTVTTWNGISWDNGDPDITKQAVVASGTLTVNEDLEMCTLYVTGTAQVVVESGVNLTVANEVNVAGTASMIVENNANLIQIDNVQNTGSIKVFRDSSALKRLDYTLWSSPVTGQNLFGFSDETLPNRFYTYNSTNNKYSPIQDLGPESETVFAKGRGYLIRTPNNHPVTPAIWTGMFEGLPNSGTVSVPLNTSNDPNFRYNLVGNPYPSAIDIKRLVDRNENTITGQIWFWRKTNNPLAPSYCTVTASGDYIGNTSLENSQNYNPQGIIRTGQGFFVEASSSSPGSIIFNNSLREANNSNRFFRTAMDGETEINRFWLNIAKEGEFYGQTLINYRTGATQGLDYGIDGKSMENDGAFSLYSIAEDKNLGIQGRSLPFSTEDVVPLGLRADEPGTMSIVLDNFDGLFTSQDIYIKDNLLGVTHNIRNGAYEFATEAGTFNDRFEVVYADELGTENPAFDTKSIIVFKQGNGITINSGNEDIASVSIYDMRGRLLYQQNGINAEQTVITGLQAQQQVLIMQVTSVNGAKADKKILY